MATPNINTDKIQEYLDRRISILESAGKSLLLGDNLTVQVLNAFTGFVKSFLNISSTNDSNYFTQKFNEFYTSMIQPMPSDELAATGIVGLSHNKFTTLTQAILLHPECGNFFHAVIKEGANATIKDLGNFMGDLNSLKSVFITHLQELGPYIAQLENNPSLALQTIINNRQPEITSLANGLYLKMFGLYSTLKKANDFSPSYANGIYDMAHELNTILTGLDGLKSMPTSIGDLTSNLTEVKSLYDVGNRLYARVNAMADLDINLKDTLDYGSLLDKNMRHLLSASRNLAASCSSLSTASSFGDNSLSEATRQINGMLPYLKGFMKSMAQKNMTTKLFEPGPNRDMLDTLKTSIAALTDPQPHLTTIKNDFQATMQLTKDLMHGKVPFITAIPTLISRINSNVATVDSFVSAATSAFSAYTPVIGSIADSALAALKATAPTPLMSLASGDISSFQQALVDPRAITKIGPVMAEISKFLGDTTGLTISQVSTANTLLDYVSKEHTRESITTYLADSDLQKSIALAGLKSYIGTNVAPIQNTLNVFKNMF